MPNLELTWSLWVSHTWTRYRLVKGVGSGFWIFLEYQSDSSCEILLDFVESCWISKRLGQISMRSQQFSIDRTENTNKPLLSVENDGFSMCRWLKISFSCSDLPFLGFGGGDLSLTVISVGWPVLGTSWASGSGHEFVWTPLVAFYDLLNRWVTCGSQS